MCPVRVPIWFPFFCALFTGLLFWSLPTAGEESERPPVRCWFANYAQPFLVQGAKRVDLAMANDGKMAYSFTEWAEFGLSLDVRRDGKRVPGAPFEKFGKPYRQVDIPAGAEITTRIDLNAYYVMEEPGEYEVHLVGMMLRKDGERFALSVPLQASCKIRVVEGSQKECQEEAERVRLSFASRDAAVREDAVRVLQFCDLPGRSELLAQGLRDPNERVAEASCSALATIDIGLAREVALAAIREERRGTRLAEIVRSLGPRNDRDTSVAIVKVVASRDLATRQEVAGAFRRGAERKAVQGHFEGADRDDMKEFQAAVRNAKPLDYFSEWWEDMTTEDRAAVSAFFSGL